MSLLGFDTLQLVWIGVTMLLAFVMLGVSGFGLSMIGVGSLSILRHRCKSCRPCWRWNC